MIKLHTESPLALALRRLLKKLEDSLELSRPITLTLAGGMAAHLYTRHRVTTDVDAEFSARVIIPNGMAVELVDPDFPDAGGSLYIDTNYNSSFALMHEDYLSDAIPVPLDGLKWITVRALCPVDLAVSKIARLRGPDMEDICMLATAGLVTAEEIRARAEEAMVGYIGNPRMLKLNLQDVLNASQEIEGNREADGGVLTHSGPSSR
jgi:hypothetical protein